MVIWMPEARLKPETAHEKSLIPRAEYMKKSGFAFHLISRSSMISNRVHYLWKKNPQFKKRNHAILHLYSRRLSRGRLPSIPCFAGICRTSSDGWLLVCCRQYVWNRTSKREKHNTIRSGGACFLSWACEEGGTLLPHVPWIPLIRSPKGQEILALLSR